MCFSMRRAHPWVAMAAALFAAAPPAAQAQGYPPAGPTYPPSAPPAAPPLTTGGLTPPAAIQPRPGETETLQRLEEAEREDSGRGLEFVWVNVEAGYEYLALQSFRDDALLDGEVIGDDGSAFVVGAGAGVRLVFVRLGARFRLAQLGDWDIWTLNGEVGVHYPMGSLEPSFTLGAGYAALSAQGGGSAAGPGDLEASGFDVRLGAALDWYLNPLLSLGAQSSFELLALHRDGSSATSSAADPELAELYASDGDGLGFGVTLTAVAGLHF